MGNIVELYTSREGRISRKTWWLATIGLFVVIMIVEFGIFGPFGFGPTAVMSAVQSGDAAGMGAAITDATHKSAWANFVIYALAALPIVAIGVKRRHDRDNSGIDVMIFYGIAIVVDLLEALGVGYTVADLGNGASIPVPGVPLGILTGLVGIYAIYLVVVCGFLKGTTGANQYGQDPLLVGSAAAA